MLVNYVVFDVDTDDRPAFDAWYAGLAAHARQEHGCVLYEYLTDPAQPGRGMTIAAWEREEDIAAHRTHPSHIELMALGSTKWGIHNVRVHSFTDVSGYRLSERDRLDAAGGEDAESRATMLALIAEYRARPTRPK